jgi:Arginine methyltransferase oligomerization subdomain
MSTRAELPERVDVVVTDQIGRFGLEAGAPQYLSDARRRWLKPGGRTVPCDVALHVALVAREDVWRQVDFWRTRPVGFDFTPARRVAISTGYPVTLRPVDLLAPPAMLARVAFDDEGAALVQGEASFTLDVGGPLHGIGGWFDARLSPSITMTNSPFAADRINRRNVFFPLERVVDVAAGDRVRVTMKIRAEDAVYAWAVEITRRNGDADVRFSQSTFGGMLIAAEDLARTRPGWTPCLTPAGEARRTVLALCDAAHTLAAIEDEVFRRHPTLFRSRDEAAGFVAEVVTRYAR